MDWRDKRTLPAADLVKMLSGDALIYAAGLGEQFPNRIDLASMRRGTTLALMTIPPSAEDLRRVLEQVQPDRIFVIGKMSGSENPTGMLKRIFTLLSPARAEQQRSWLELMTACNHSRETVRAAVMLLDERGDIEITQTGEDGFRYRQGDRKQKPGMNVASVRLIKLVKESESFQNLGGYLDML
jgi:hypothetical protein